MHNVHLIRRHFPKHAKLIIITLATLLFIALAIGAGLLIMF